MSFGRYFISSGELILLDVVDHSPNERVIYETLRGYAGRGTARNDPEKTHLRGIGPLPVGFYDAVFIALHPGLGPDVFALLPDRANRMFGRSGFYIHGDSREHPGDASSGCIILPRSSRIALDALGLKRLEVVPDPPSTAREVQHRT